MQNIKQNRLLIIDIETVPERPSYEMLSDDWKKLWFEKVAKSLPADRTVEDFYEDRAGIMAEFGKVICISLGYFDHEDNFYVKAIYGHDERQLLSEFLDLLFKTDIVNNKWFFCGHNIKEFDIPYLCRRLLINGLPLPPFLDFQNMKPWETNLIDTFQYWRFGDYKNYTSLNLLAASLGIESPKNDIDGSMVADVYYKTNDGLQRIANYCCQDVIAVAQIMRRFMGKGLLQSHQIIEK